MSIAVLGPPHRVSPSFRCDRPERRQYGHIHHQGRQGVFAIAMIDASIIGAAAVGLSTSCAVSDVLGLKHSLHRKPSDAKGFYVVFALLMAVAAAVVLIPVSPLSGATRSAAAFEGAYPSRLNGSTSSPAGDRVAVSSLIGP